MKIGWYPDPDDDNARRYWDGEEWSAPLPKDPVSTQKVAPTPAPSPQPAAPTKPFDPMQPISDDNPVPEDCVWFYAPYPGPLPKKPGWGYTVPQKFMAIGDIKGRTLAEIEHFVGLPQSWMTISREVRHATWSSIKAFGGTYMYTLSFDPYDLCFGVVSQYDA